MVFSDLFRKKRRLDDLDEAEMLALAISAEEDDARIYREFSDKLREKYPESAEQFEEMAREEDGHRQALINVFRIRFGEKIPLVRREHIADFPPQRHIGFKVELTPKEARAYARNLEETAERYYLHAARNTNDVTTRKLLGDLAVAESGHIQKTGTVFQKTHTIEAEDRAAHRNFVLTYIQPGLAGFIDGSISTLAPIFATAFATGNTWTTFLVGLSASVGAGISMGFTEAISDDGVISGRGSPMTRGVITGLMTTLGGLGHALPYLIPDFWLATMLAFAIVGVELSLITYAQNRYMETPIPKALLQVVLGGMLVLAAGVFIGSF